MTAGLAGSVLIGSAFIASAWSVVAVVIGVRARNPRLLETGRRALYSATILIAAATGVLVIALFSRDFSLEYVAGYSSRSTPLPYTLTSLWAGMEGSLLFWSLLTAVYASTAIAVQHLRRSNLVPIAGATLGVLLLFFTGLMLFAANPFRQGETIPPDGAGLNPLLQSPYMTIHPVLLYLGFTGFSVPFAFALSALVSGRLEPRWFTTTRRWTVLAWSFLSIGIVLGAAWAYNELGWGGYWAWDPVENASLLPWLTGTAFLHSVMIQERRGMLKVWNVALILGTYGLAIFGTFLTRSGLLSSVHTFSESPVGKYFLPFLALILIGSFTMLGLRADRLRSDRHLDSVVSRESMFLFNNLFFTAIAFTVLWGTLYPVLTEAITGQKVSVGPPYFNAVVIPLGLALLALAGIGPLVAWRRASGASLKRHFKIPLAAGALTVLGLAVAGVLSAGALLAFGLSAFVVATTVGEFVRGTRAHRRVEGGSRIQALMTLIGRNRRRYGGYIIHLGIVLIVIGIAGGAFRRNWSGRVEVGDSFRIGSYTVTYKRPIVRATEERMIAMAVMEVRQGDRFITTLRPQRNFHFPSQQPQSEIGLRTTAVEDLYIAISQMDAERAIELDAWVNPLVMWIWIGGLVMAAGMVVMLSGKPSLNVARAPMVESKVRRDKTAVPV
jgi:cytochrome c-type biogenesis protein CcmF